MKRLLTLLFVSCLFISCSEQRQPADSIIVGKIWTGNAQEPWAEAIAILGDSIVAVGTLEKVKKWAGENTVTNSFTESQLIVPGFIDTHTHFVDGGFRLSSVQLRDAKTKQEFIDRIKKFAESVAPGTWITGGDWDH